MKQPVDNEAETVGVGISSSQCKVYRVEKQGVSSQAKFEQVCVEAPLQINLIWQVQGLQSRQQELTEKVFMTTMRTPGQDSELALGLLIASQVIEQAADVIRTTQAEANQVDVELQDGISPDWRAIERLGLSLSSCGICGQKQIQQLALKKSEVTSQQGKWLAPEHVVAMPDALKQAQTLFDSTGGVHAAAIWQKGNIIACCEDIGRHNAVDKVIGLQLAKSNELQESVLILSGRVSFELVQKAIMADIPVIVAIGAPSSLAISMAKQFNITLIGFTKAQKFNVYSGEFRLI